MLHKHTHASTHEHLFSVRCVQVGNRIIPKRLHVRVEHVQPSRCREDFMKRRAANDAKKHDAKVKGGEWLSPACSSYASFS